MALVIDGEISIESNADHQEIGLLVTVVTKEQDLVSGTSGEQAPYFLPPRVALSALEMIIVLIEQDPDFHFDATR